MNKLIIAILLFPITILAQSFLISNIPLPKTYVQNLDPYECEEDCLQKFLDNGQIFSFLSFADSKLENEAHDEIRMINVSILNLGSTIVSGELKIALLLPYKVIGRYASTTTSASFAYLIAKNRSFDLKSYKIDAEDHETIKTTLEQIKDDGFNYVIAPLTQKGADIVAEIDPDINVYFPTINKKDMQESSANLYYGGIDYRAQSDLLLAEAVSPLIIFHDKSEIGNKLAEYEKEKFSSMDIFYRYPFLEFDENTTNLFNEIASNSRDPFTFMEANTSIKTYDFYAYLNEPRRMLDEDKVVIKYSIPKRTTNLEYQLRSNYKIDKGSFFINTPIIKSSMIMSQLTLYDTNVTNILSTQINYDPILFSMTQFQDRRSMIVANSITEKNNVITEVNSLLGNDIVYDWINYTTTIGIDYFFNIITHENREYNIDMQENQMQYPIELLKPSMSRFIAYKSIFEK